jgi:hypothetical protein
MLFSLDAESRRSPGVLSRRATNARPSQSHLMQSHRRRLINTWSGHTSNNSGTVVLPPAMATSDPNRPRLHPTLATAHLEPSPCIRRLRSNHWPSLYRPNRGCGVATSCYHAIAMPSSLPWRIERTTRCQCMGPRQTHGSRSYVQPIPSSEALSTCIARQ